LKEADIQVAESFLARRIQLSNRRELSLRVAHMLLTRMEQDTTTISTSEQADALILSVVNLYREREAGKPT
jgi:hypothetical protein